MIRSDLFKSLFEAKALTPEEKEARKQERTQKKLAAVKATQAEVPDAMSPEQAEEERKKIEFDRIKKKYAEEEERKKIESARIEAEKLRAAYQVKKGLGRTPTLSPITKTAALVPTKVSDSGGTRLSDTQLSDTDLKKRYAADKATYGVYHTLDRANLSDLLDSVGYLPFRLNRTSATLLLSGIKYVAYSTNSIKFCNATEAGTTPALTELGQLLNYTGPVDLASSLTEVRIKQIAFNSDAENNSLAYATYVGLVFPFLEAAELSSLVKNNPSFQSALIQADKDYSGSLITDLDWTNPDAIDITSFGHFTDARIAANLVKAKSVILGKSKGYRPNTIADAKLGIASFKAALDDALAATWINNKYRNRAAQNIYYSFVTRVLPNDVDLFELKPDEELASDRSGNVLTNSAESLIASRILAIDEIPVMSKGIVGQNSKDRLALEYLKRIIAQRKKNNKAQVSSAAKGKVAEIFSSALSSIPELYNYNEKLNTILNSSMAASDLDDSTLKGFAINMASQLEAFADEGLALLNDPEMLAKIRSHFEKSIKASPRQYSLSERDNVSSVEDFYGPFVASAKERMLIIKEIKEADLFLVFKIRNANSDLLLNRTDKKVRKEVRSLLQEYSNYSKSRLAKEGAIGFSFLVDIMGLNDVVYSIKKQLDKKLADTDKTEPTETKKEAEKQEGPRDLKELLDGLDISKSDKKAIEKQSGVSYAEQDKEAWSKATAKWAAARDEWQKSADAAREAFVSSAIDSATKTAGTKSKESDYYHRIRSERARLNKAKAVLMSGTRTMSDVFSSIKENLNNADPKVAKAIITGNFSDADAEVIDFIKVLVDEIYGTYFGPNKLGALSDISEKDQVEAKQNKVISSYIYNDILEKAKAGLLVATGELKKYTSSANSDFVNFVDLAAAINDTSKGITVSADGSINFGFELDTKSSSGFFSDIFFGSELAKVGRHPAIELAVQRLIIKDLHTVIPSVITEKEIDGILLPSTAKDQPALANQIKNFFMSIRREALTEPTKMIDSDILATSGGQSVIVTSGAGNSKTFFIPEKVNEDYEKIITALGVFSLGILTSKVSGSSANGKFLTDIFNAHIVASEAGFEGLVTRFKLAFDFISAAVNIQIANETMFGSEHQNTAAVELIRKLQRENKEYAVLDIAAAKKKAEQLMMSFSPVQMDASARKPRVSTIKIKGTKLVSTSDNHISNHIVARILSKFDKIITSEAVDTWYQQAAEETERSKAEGSHWHSPINVLLSKLGILYRGLVNIKKVPESPFITKAVTEATDPANVSLDREVESETNSPLAEVDGKIKAVSANTRILIKDMSSKLFGMRSTVLGRDARQGTNYLPVISIRERLSNSNRAAHRALVALTPFLPKDEVNNLASDITSILTENNKKLSEFSNIVTSDTFRIDNIDSQRQVLELLGSLVEPKYSNIFRSIFYKYASDTGAIETDTIQLKLKVPEALYIEQLLSKGNSIDSILKQIVSIMPEFAKAKETTNKLPSSTQINNDTESPKDFNGAIDTNTLKTGSESTEETTQDSLINGISIEYKHILDILYGIGVVSKGSYLQNFDGSPFTRWSDFYLLALSTDRDLVSDCKIVNKGLTMHEKLEFRTKKGTEYAILSNISNIIKLIDMHYGTVSEAQAKAEPTKDETNETNE